MFSPQTDAFSQLIGHASSVQSVIRTAQIAAATDVHVLIEGETGTGKELLARAIQQSSPRADKPFIIVNCAALPVELAESLLFGHEAGAFTGAIERKPGSVQAADTGTLFLDEIGDLPVAVQGKLLRFIENGECHRLGAHTPEYVDVRIIAATHRNLLEMIDQGLFRHDLFYRLSVVNMRLPPLRERVRDIPELALHFLEAAATRQHKPVTRLSADAIHRLKHYSWPGNVRELRNLCERISTLMPGKLIDSSELPLELFVSPQLRTTASSFNLPQEGINMESLEADLIDQALEQARGNKSRAARLLGLSRDAFLYRIKKHKKP
ncbi:MAG: sigma-54 dependent transcriptional regulator [Gammaproteobacteria bacterium]